MLEVLATAGEVDAPLVPQLRHMGEIAVLAPTPEAPTPDYVDIELRTGDETERARAWYALDNGATYMEALRYGKEHDATVLWGVAKPGLGSEGSRQKLAIIFEHDALAGDQARRRGRRAGDPIVPTLAGVASQAVADRVGDGYTFDTHEYYGQGVWESVRI